MRAVLRSVRQRDDVLAHRVQAPAEVVDAVTPAKPFGVDLVHRHALVAQRLRLRFELPLSRGGSLFRRRGRSLELGQLLGGGAFGHACHVQETARLREASCLSSARSKLGELAVQAVRPQGGVVERLGHRLELRDAGAKVGTPLGDGRAAVGPCADHSGHVIDAVKGDVASDHDSAEKAPRDRLVAGIDTHVVEERGRGSITGR